MASQHSRRSREAPREMTIGPYTRLNKIGQGSFATVYQGVHTVSHRESGFLCSGEVLIVVIFG